MTESFFVNFLAVICAIKHEFFTLYKAMDLQGLKSNVCKFYVRYSVHLSTITFLWNCYAQATQYRKLEFPENIAKE